MSENKRAYKGLNLYLYLTETLQLFDSLHQHLYRKRIKFTKKRPPPPPNSCECMRFAIRGQYILCFFIEDYAFSISVMKIIYVILVNAQNS